MCGWSSRRSVGIRRVWLVISVGGRNEVCVVGHLGGRQVSCVFGCSSRWAAGIRRVWVVILVFGRNQACVGGHLGSRQVSCVFGCTSRWGWQESGVCGWLSRLGATGIRCVWVVISAGAAVIRHVWVVISAGAAVIRAVCGWSSRRWRLESGVCGCRRIGGGERAYSSVVGTDDGGYNIV